jgi:DNA polymerase-3 subunit epsilon
MPDPRNPEPGSAPPSDAPADEPSPHLLLGEFAALDFESARLRQGGGDAPVEIGIVRISQGCIVSHLTWRSFLLPPGPVYPGPGLRDPELLRQAPPLLSLWPRVRDSLQGCTLLAHGAGTEKRFLRAFPGHGFGPWVDTLRLARAMLPTAPSHALGDLCTDLGLTAALAEAGFAGTWHEALYDAAASWFLFAQLLRQGAPADLDLQTLQTPDLAAYFAARRTPT